MSIAMSEDTFIRPGYRKTSAGHAPIDGVQFFSYSVGILRYARISADGQIMTQANYHGSTYTGYVVGHGPIRNKEGNAIKFRTERAAALAAIKRFRGQP